MGIDDNASDALPAWDPEADPSTRREWVDKLAEAAPDPKLATLALNALAAEDAHDISRRLFWQVGRHRGHETPQDDGRTTLPDTVNGQTYVDALALASSVAARNSIHSAAASYKPASSDTISDPRASLLAASLRESRDGKEQRTLLHLLAAEAGWDAVRRLQILETWLTPERSPSGEEVSLWAKCLEKAQAARPWQADDLRARGASRLVALLRSSKEASGRARAVGLLAHQLEGPETKDGLLVALKDADPNVSGEAASRLNLLGEAGIQLAREMLATSDTLRVLFGAWNALGHGDVPVVERLESLSVNPNSRVAAEAALRLLVDRPPGELDHLREAWPRLPAGFRDSLAAAWRGELELHHRRFYHPFWWEWMDELRRPMRRNPELLAASLSWMTRPLHEVIGAYDLESVTGLRRTDPVELRVDPLLRFGFLQQARSHRGEPIADVARGGRFSLDELVKTEAARDQDRDRLAELRRELDEAAGEVGDEVLGQIRNLGRDIEFLRGLRERFGKDGGRLLELQQAFYRQQRRLAGQSDETGQYRTLFAATEHLAGLLREVGCSFEGLAAPDGVLGEYQPVDRAITLFSPMLDLAADAVAQVVQSEAWEGEAIAAGVRTVVELHELAHAHLHLGRDARHSIWQSPEHASSAFHEALAQVYTRRMVDKIGDPMLSSILDTMEDWLPPEYRYGDVLAGLDPEALRQHVVARRVGSHPRSLFEVARAVLAALPGYLELRKSLFADDEHLALRAAVRRSELLRELKALDAAPPSTFPTALASLLETLEGLPKAPKVLGAFVDGGWPTAAERRLLLFEARTVGPELGKSPLRWIHADDVQLAMDKSQSSAQLGIRHAVAECVLFVAPEPEQEEARVDEAQEEGKRRKTRRRRAK